VQHLKHRHKGQHTGWEDEKLLKLSVTSAQVHNSAYLTHHALSSSLLWHARFGHINYDSLRLFQNNGFYDL